MAEKHVAVCDGCGQEEPLLGVEYLRSNAHPVGWLRVLVEDGRTDTRAVEPLSFCSWSCVGDPEMKRDEPYWPLAVEAAVLSAYERWQHLPAEKRGLMFARMIAAGIKKYDGMLR